MGVELMEIRGKTKEAVNVTTRTCYRSICNHPFLVGWGLLLIFVYRSFPFFFSLLVSASPVFVCTAALLGTLLSLGQHNVPETGNEENGPHESRSLRAGVSGDAIVVGGRDESFPVGRHPGRRRDGVEKSIEKPSFGASNASDTEDNFHDVASSMRGNSRELQLEKRVDGASERKLHDLRFRKKGEMSDEKLKGSKVLGHQYSRIPTFGDEDIEAEEYKSPVEFLDSPVSDDSVSSPVSPWKQVDKEADDAFEDDEASDFGSDRAESFSPDTSLADILPMLDELHPLLDADAPQPALISHDGSDAASERSLKSSNDINESDEGPDIHEEEFGDDDNDDDEEEEEMHRGKMDRTKSAITWTEDDQKNLMDLGSSELERNQRLEMLIARRMAKKDPKMVPEKNLIDLESSDPPFNVPPISTARCNPFDLPDDSNDNTGLPPIPGSAPSIFVPRQNPFDLPYDSILEKPELMGNSFQPEFLTFHPKETFFRRHESFNMGPSWFRSPRHDKQDIRLRPFFIPDRVPSEGPSYAPFQRQLSEISESGTSSIMENESVCATVDQEEEELIYEDLSHDVLMYNTNNASELVRHGSQTPEVLGSAKLDQAEKTEVKPSEVEIKLGDLENHHEMGSSVSEARGVAIPLEHNTSEVYLNISHREHASEHVEHSTQSSGVLDPVKLGPDEKRKFDLKPVEIILGDMENHQEMGPSLSGSGAMATPLEHNTGKVNLTTGAVDKTITSSSTALLDVNEMVFDEKGDEKLSKMESREGNLIIDESAIPRQPSQEELVDDNQNKDPVYDSSPPAGDKSLSSQVGISETGLWQVLVKRIIALSSKESEASNHNVETDFPSNEETLAGSSRLHATDENEMGSRDVTKIKEPDVLDVGLSRVDGNFDSANASMVPDTVAEHASINSKPPSKEVPSSSFGADIHVVFQQDVGENVDSVALGSGSSGNLNLIAEKNPSLVVEEVSDVPPNTSFRTEPIQERSVDKVVALDQIQTSNSHSNFHADNHQEADEKLIYTHHQYASEEKRTLDSEKQMPLTDITVVEVSSVNHEKPQELSIIQVETIQEVSTSSHLKVLEIPEAENRVSSNVSSPGTPYSVSFPPEISATQSTTGLAESKDIKFDGTKNQEQIQVIDHLSQPPEAPVSQPNIIEEVDEIKEIDEGLLSRLDTVGDFSAKELGTNLNEIEKHLVPAVETKSIGIVEGIGMENCGASRTEEEIVPNQAVDAASGLQMSGTSCTKHVGSSSGEFIHGEVKNSAEFKPINDEAVQKNIEVELEHSKTSQNPIAEESNSRIPVIEARSVEDINHILKQTEPIPTKTEVKLEDLDMPHQGQSGVEINSGVQVLEARSLEDINSAVKQISKEAIVKPTVIVSQTSLELPVPEARSIKDTDLASKQPHEGVSVEKCVLPSVVDDRPDVIVSTGPAATNSDSHVVPETLLKSNSEDGTEKSKVNEVSSSNEIESSIKTDAPETSTSSVEKPGQGVQTSESTGPAGTSSDLHVVKESSLEDPSALKQALGGNLETLQKSNAEDGKGKNEVNVASSSNKNESSIKASDVLETSTSTVEKPGHEVQKSETLLKSNSEDGKAKSEVNVASSSNKNESSIKASDVPETSTSTAEKPGHGVQTSDALNVSKTEAKKAESQESSSISSSK